MTNIEADHLDIYADLADLRAHLRAVRRAARATSCSAPTTPGANALPTPASAEVIRYGLTSPDARLARDRSRAATGSARASPSCTTASALGEVRARRARRAQRAQRARRARRRARRSALEVPAMAPGLAAFRGVERRFQLLGERRRRARRRRLRASSHRGARHDRRRAQRARPSAGSSSPSSRTSSRARATSRASSPKRSSLADVVFLADIYPAREQPMPGVTSDLDRRRDGGAGRDARLARRRRVRSPPRSPRRVRAGDLVVTMGAGDVTRVGPGAARHARSDAAVSDGRATREPARSTSPRRCALAARARSASLLAARSRRRSGGRACCGSSPSSACGASRSSARATRRRASCSTRLQRGHDAQRVGSARAARGARAHATPQIESVTVTRKLPGTLVVQRDGATSRSRSCPAPGGLRAVDERGRRAAARSEPHAGRCARRHGGAARYRRVSSARRDAARSAARCTRRLSSDPREPARTSSCCRSRTSQSER